MSQRLQSEHLQQLLGYWESKRIGGRLPGRQDLDPSDLKPVLPYMMLTDVLDGGTRFRYRLVGTAIVEAFGRDFTGCDITDVLSGKYLEFIEALYADLVREKQPIYSQTSYFNATQRMMWTERLMLPLAADGSSVDMVACAQVFRSGLPHRVFTVRLAQERNEEIRNVRQPLD